MAKMKKCIPYMSLPWNRVEAAGQSLSNYDFCKYVKFGAISWKFYILL